MLGKEGLDLESACSCLHPSAQLFTRSVISDLEATMVPHYSFSLGPYFVPLAPLSSFDLKFSAKSYQNVFSESS